MVRRRLFAGRRLLLQQLRAALFYLWELDGTPLVVRSQIWAAQSEPDDRACPTAVQLTLLESEAARLVRILGPAVEHVFSGVVAGVPHSSTRLVHRCTVAAVQRLTDLCAKSPALLPKSLVATRLTLERTLLYDALKKRLDSPSRDAMYARFGLAQKKKRKKALSEQLWTCLDTAAASAEVVCDVLPSMIYPVDTFAVTLTAGGEIDARHFAAVEQQGVLVRSLADVARGLLAKTRNKEVKAKAIAKRAIGV
jgi:hypothetical protein